MQFRVGIGYDVHQLKEGETFTLGGIVIPHIKGALAIQMLMYCYTLLVMLY